MNEKISTDRGVEMTEAEILTRASRILSARQRGVPKTAIHKQRISEALKKAWKLKLEKMKNQKSSEG